MRFLGFEAAARHLSQRRIATSTAGSTWRSPSSRTTFAPHVAIAVGEVREDLEVADVLTGVRMVYGLVVTSSGGGTLSETIGAASRAWFGLAPNAG
ncbi:MULTISPECIES: hypothetical protein [Tessaracoccus]|uniref:hypothetical protein n=1 Tax=Tessaracoccus TaxID=72763 RepID=UPI001146AC84|nr:MULTISPECIES: hypothetical protein [Tessaracoccus]